MPAAWKQQQQQEGGGGGGGGGVVAAAARARWSTWGMCNRYCLRASTSTYNFLVQRNVASGMHSPVRRPPRARL